jgi:hypothetical protein
MPPEFIELVLEEIKTQLWIAMSLHELSTSGCLNDEDVRIQDCYTSILRSLHEAIDIGFSCSCNHLGKTTLNVVINSLFHDWCNEIAKDFHTATQSK